MQDVLRHLAKGLHGCLAVDRFRVARRLRELRGILEAGKKVSEKEIDQLYEVVRGCRERAKARVGRLPKTTFPNELPVSARRAEIAEAIRNNQVVVVCGETGSGKTTQLPKICLDAGRGREGAIGHTQPRRIAARAVAARIAEELGVPLGEAVGFKVRFGDKTSQDTVIKVMTDGILLTETQSDRPLAHYDTIIIDEAHERSLNIDFLMGYLKQLLPRRPDLKVIITSATIDPKRFSRHFFDCPVIEVSGRMYPVEVRYRPLAAQSGEDEDLRIEEGVRRAVHELMHEAGNSEGDILVFLPGEREIRLAAEDLAENTPPRTEILPLYARLSANEQQRIFSSHPAGVRRIVLSTNVAETSLTVPGIRYVIDSGLARISRYSAGTKVQRLPVEAISQASANQRSGRCGRLGPGVAVRLYAEADYAGRDRFTPPEILRTNLASVILQMTALRLGRPEEFPFIDPPEGRLIRDGYETLRELGAFDEENQITELGRRLARLPLDPRIGRMILAAQAEDCVSEVLIIASALSVEDPRERPMDLAEKADAAHEQFDDPESDFLSLVKLWRETERLWEQLSSGKLRRWCHQNFISYLKLREWRATHEQLARLSATLGLKPNEKAAERDHIHRALLAGLLCNVGRKNETAAGGGGYDGCRGVRFHIFPGSALFKKKPQFAMAAELVLTSKLYAREVAKIDPAWVERVGAHLVKKQYNEPHWDAEAAAVYAYEKISLFGLEIVSKRRVYFGTVDPPIAREIFIQRALVEEEYATPAPFFAHNRGLVARLKTLADKARRSDLAVDPRLVFEFYDKRLGPEVCSGVMLDIWRKKAEHGNPRVLFMSEHDLTPPEAGQVTPDKFPDALETFGTRLRVQYKFDPGKEEDGLTLTVPLESLHQVDAARVEWLVPGMVGAKAQAMIDALPKQSRQAINDAAGPGGVDGLALRLPGRMPFAEGHFVDALSRAVMKETGVAVSREAWRPENLPRHLKMRIRVVDSAGKLLGEDRDLSALKVKFGEKARQSFVEAAGKTFSRDGITDWDFGELPARVDLKRGNAVLAGYPAVVDRVKSVSLAVLESPILAAEATRAGVRRLFIFAARDELEYTIRLIPEWSRLALLYSSLGSPAELKEEVLAIIADRVFLVGDALPRSKEGFVKRLRERWDDVRDVGLRVAAVVAEILSLHQQLQQRLRAKRPPAWDAAAEDIKLQALLLVHKGALSTTPWERLEHVPRYLQGALLRLQKLQTAGPERDARSAGEMAELWREYLTRLDRQNKSGAPIPGTQELRWMLEELRVSLFAQELGTEGTVSVKRIRKALEAAAAEPAMDPARGASVR